MTIDQRRQVDQAVGQGRRLGGEAHVVGEPPPVDHGIGIVEDGRAVAVVQMPPATRASWAADQLRLGRGQLGLVDRSAQRGEAVDGEERLELGPVRPGRRRPVPGVVRGSMPRLYAEPHARPDSVAAARVVAVGVRVATHGRA